MIDKRVLLVDYGPIRKGMLVVPLPWVEISQIWARSGESPGLVLELFPHHSESTGAVIPMALVLLAGRRLQVSTRYIRPIPEEEQTA